MTTLLLDAGNSRFKWGLRTDRGITEQGIGVYGGDDYAAAVIGQLNALWPFHRLIVSSVLTAVFKQRLQDWAGSITHLDVLFLADHQTEVSIALAYNNPIQLGSDRVAAMLAAYHLYSTDCIIVDCGTAVTIDAITHYGQHLGGLILPGPELSISALTDRAPGITRGPVETPRLFADSTGQAVFSGVIYMISAGINHIVNAMGQELTSPVTYLLTGGDAERLLPALQHPYQLEPALVLKGLGIVADG